MPARPGPLFDLRDIPAALGLLTRLPVKVNTAFALTRGAAAAWAWPLAGTAVALIAGGAGWAAQAAGLAPGAAAGLVLLAQVFVTGAMHEDGLADCADGIWGGWTRRRRLEIMKDSRIGAYGVLGLVLFMGLRWQALMLALPLGAAGWGLYLAAQMVSRGIMAWAMAGLPHARPGGLAASAGRPSARTAAAALPLMALPLFQPGGWAMALGALAAAALSFGLARLARARLGGQTGDVLGAMQICSELCLMLLALCLLAPAA
ncbi:adenosylcobinamide-GDP ribazoletransferase [Mangrovicoccus sp. HB161399]|uniref:adenosylcobinamide-GDP ribazoletransferase n=1 Tax=Mangrovicoccus sp. HB161399 TaxID=2720392 RepID=UPI0015546EDE|nr:adenosylcobinamide-GDP ribazoletransferase [Mangrovicoccus sp. HB161399]